MALTQPTTEIEIISRAATLLGKQSFSSLDSGGSFALDGDALLGTLVTGELASNRWRFALAYKEMGTLTALTPSFDNWSYYWEMPSDLLMLLYIDPFVKYAVFGNRVLTTSNSTTLTAVYSKSVPVSQWPSTFSMYIIYQLASMLAISVTNSDRMLARINADRDLWHSRALFADGQNSTSNTIRSNPYIDIRYQYKTRRGS
jgi:hypothetical protein